MVSVDPIKTEATLPAKLSGPKLDSIESSNARDPLPEMGLNIISGIIGVGIPKCLNNKLKNDENISKKPDALSIDTAVIKPMIEGTMEKVEWTPSFAPLMNESKTSIFLAIPNVIIITIMHGTT